MKRILLIIIIIMVAKSCLSQQPAATTSPTDNNGWLTTNSYIIGSSATVLGTILINNFYNKKERVDSASSIEITPQFGPSINWLAPNAQLEQFYQSIGTTNGSLWGYSTGIMIGARKNKLTYKSGMFFESKGGSYQNTSYVVLTNDQGTMNVVKMDMNSSHRLNYLTIPFTVGAQTRGKARVGVDVGAFVSLPISERYQTTFNGTITEYKPTTSIGPNFGIIANLGAKLPITDQVDLSIDTRVLSSLTDINGSSTLRSFNQGVQFLLGFNMRLSK